MIREGKLEKGTTLDLDQDSQLLTFKLDEQEYALDIANVVQVVRMVALTRAPKAPEIVEGIINLRGSVIPVVDLRKRLDLPLKPRGLNDHLLISRTNGHSMALIVDAVSEVLNLPASSLDFSSEIGSQVTEFLKAVGRMGDRLLLILDLDKILTFEEEKGLDELLVELGAMLAPDNRKRLKSTLAGWA